ncbi:uncharacterized protein BHQ10_009184 [Talaromyces amestolkiae]|uniref:Methyltransferase type 11 domain-containing protein n=1 Tax=Talaromyces amestolkiae TaxID=1196081 RepID=A0A364LBI5_TALAM|nr:uncharacterized protein BHQ10_009184 [Talaromyces amestolkiae]RAO73172.1 hypothetical protein BHQ10_009184 [Talaromyces amestolkiae]
MYQAKDLIHFASSDFGSLHPSTKVIGTDLSPIQPSLVPPNLQFEIDDCCDEWTYAPKTFDFVHVRGLYGCVADWDEFYKRALRHLKPGGYLEQAEISVVPKSQDGSTDGTIFDKWGAVSLKAGDAFGKTLRISEEAKERIIAAGFVDVVERRFKVPIGPWARDPHLKELGRYNRLYWKEGIQGWTMMLLTKILKWKREEVEIYLMEVRQALRNPSYHAYHEFIVVYGRKAPET